MSVWTNRRRTGKVSVQNKNFKRRWERRIGKIALDPNNPYNPFGSSSRSLLFDGNDKVTMTLVDNAALSIFAAVKPTSFPTAGNSQTVFAHNDGCCLELVNEGGNKTIQINRPGVQRLYGSADTMVENAWQLIGWAGLTALGTSAAVSALFRNGVELAETSSGSDNLASSTDGCFGNRNAGTPGLIGNAAWLAIWNGDQLTAAEALELYNGGTLRDPRTNVGDYTSAANLSYFWKVDDGVATITDLVGSVVGTITGAVWSPDGPNTL